MPRFAANLSFLFNEVPFLDRFRAAATAGFRAVEFMFPYEHSAGAVAECLTGPHLENILFNMPPGDWAAGDRGIACLPGREEEFRRGVATALAYARALGTTRLHAMAGIAPLGPEARAAGDRTYLDNLRYVRYLQEEAARLGVLHLDRVITDAEVSADGENIGCLVDDSGERLAFGSTTGGLWISEDARERWSTVTHTLPPVYAVRFG